MTTTWLRCAAVAVVMTFAAGCAGSSGPSGSSGDDTPEGDASAQLACTHFRNIVDDASAGILTDAEIRDKLKEVYDKAYVSSTRGIADGARELLAGITTGTTSDFETALDSFSSACTRVGL